MMHNWVIQHIGHHMLCVCACVHLCMFRKRHSRLTCHQHLVIIVDRLDFIFLHLVESCNISVVMFQMLRILDGELYSSVKSEVAFCPQQAMTANAPLKSVCDSGIDSIRDLEKSGRQTLFLLQSFADCECCRRVAISRN